MEKPLPLLALTAILGLAGEAHTSAASDVKLPPDVDGYRCYRRQEMTNGYVDADASPDYHGGSRTFSMTWLRKERDTRITLSWASRSRSVTPPGLLNVWQNVRPPIPPLHTKMYLKLSSGEVQEKELIEPLNWQNWQQRGSNGYGEFLTSDSKFIDAFTHAEWADVDLVAPDGTQQAHIHFDLAELPRALEAMRRLGEEVEAAAADYQHSCAPFQMDRD